MIDFATRDDLKSLSGYQKPETVMRFLRDQRIPFIVGKDGWPRVLSAVINERLGGQITPAPREPRLRLPQNGSNPAARHAL